MDQPADAIVFIYTTAGSEEDAAEIAAKLVENGLAACANIFPTMTSVYAWKGEIHRDSETAMILKTRAALQGDAMAAIRSIHKYDTPAIVAFPASGVDAGFASWLMEQTSRAKKAG